MENYEVKLMQEHNKKMLEYLEKGYILKSGDSGAGYFSRVELFNPKFPETYIRIYIKNINTFGSPEGFEKIEYNYNLKFFELGVLELKSKEIFERNSKTLEVFRFYVIRNSFLTNNGKLAKEYSDKSLNRFKARNIKNNHTFNPDKSLNIRGFKSLKPECVEITRYYKSPYNSYNYYEIKNLKNGKIIKKYIK